MTSLEWVNAQKEECKKTIDDLKNRIIEDSKYPSLVNEYNEQIRIVNAVVKYFENIKIELEAWEVIKPYIKYEEEENDEGVYMEYSLLFEIEDWKPEAFKIKKALEIKDEIN